MKINRQRLKEIIRSVIAEEKSYEEFFRGELEKAGFSSPAEMSDAEKREFFNRIDSEWKAKNEELVGNQHKLDVDGDGEIEASDLAALRAGKKPVKEQQKSFDFGNDEVNGIFAKFKKLNPKKTQRKEGIAYSYNYGTGGITFIVKDNDVKFAMFETDRVHDFLGHMQSLGFGPNLFARLTKLARKEELKGYTTVLHFGQPKNEGKKRFYQQDGIGKAKYTISYHDGKQKHKDGSDFYGIQIFRNQKDLEKFRTALLKKGYREDSGYKKESVNEVTTVIKTKDGKLHNYPNFKKNDVINFLTKKGMKLVSNEKDLKSNMDFYILESVNEGKKRFYQQDGIGKAKYTISYHDGKQKHKDGSDFYGIQIFRNQKDLEKFRTALLKKGYREDSGYKKESVNEEIKVGGKTYPVKEQKSKYYVEIDSPREVDSNRVKGEIKSLMKRGARSADIGLRMNFLTTDPKDMMNKFQKVKNHVYFANDPMRFESVDEGVMKPGKKIKLISGWAGQNQPTKNDKYVIYQLVNNRHFSLRGLRGGMTYLWKAIESTDPHIKVGSTEEIHPKALKKGIKHGFYVMESVVKEGRHDKDLDKVEAAVKNASSFMGVGAELKKAGIKYDFSTSMMPMYRIKVAGNTIAIVNKRYASGAEREVGDIAIGLLEGKIGRSLKVENLSPDVAKLMMGIHKGFQKVEGDGTMIYDTPANAKKAADFLNKKKVAASSDGKYLYIESKTRR